MSKTSIGVRIPALDGFRGWAVIAVMFYHFALPSVGHTHGVASWVTLHLFLTGSYGVDMFFILSGFLITGILLDSKADAHYFRDFYMRRVLRIFPLYYGVLLVCFGLLFWLPAIKPFVHHQAWLWLYVANFAGLKGITFQPIFDHFWSLAVEEQFYFFWPLIVMLLPRKALIGLCVVMAIGSVTLRCALIGSNLLPDELAASLTPCRLDGLALGALVAAIARGPTGLLHLRWHAPWIAVVTFLVFAASKILVRSSGGIWGMLGIGLFATVVMLTAILVLAIEESSLAGRSFFVAPLRFFGKYSYGLYVYHFLIHPWLDVHFWYVRSMPFPSLILHILAASGTTMIIALASWHLYERHFLRLKKLFGHSHNPIQPKVELLPASSSKV